MDRDPTVDRSAARFGRSWWRRRLRANWQIITALVLLGIFGAVALSLALNTESATARILGQQGSHGFRQITIEFEHDGELYNITDSFDVEGIQEGDVVRVWFDSNDPEFVEFSKAGLFVGFYVIIAGLLVWLAIAIVRRVRRPGRRRRRGAKVWDSVVDAYRPAPDESDRPDSS
jgi:hypothetical protein